MESLPPSVFDAGAVAQAAAAALEDARQAIGVKRTALFWLDDAQERLTCVATAGAGDRDRWVGQTLATNLGMAGRAVREGHPVWTPDLLADPRVPIAPWLRERGSSAKRPSGSSRTCTWGISWRGVGRWSTRRGSARTRS